MSQSMIATHRRQYTYVKFACEADTQARYINYKEGHLIHRNYLVHVVNICQCDISVSSVLVIVNRLGALYLLRAQNASMVGH